MVVVNSIGLIKNDVIAKQFFNSTEGGSSIKSHDFAFKRETEAFSKHQPWYLFIYPFFSALYPR